MCESIELLLNIRTTKVSTMTARKITTALSILSFLLLSPALVLAQGKVVESGSHRFEEVAEGVSVSYTHLRAHET